MAYYKLRLDVWCDWDPEDRDLEEVAQNISAGYSICTRRKVIAVAHRPQDIEDEAAMSFFGGRRGRCRPESGAGCRVQYPAEKGPSVGTLGLWFFS